MSFAPTISPAPTISARPSASPTITPRPTDGNGSFRSDVGYLASMLGSIVLLLLVV